MRLVFISSICWTKAAIGSADGADVGTCPILLACSYVVGMVTEGTDAWTSGAGVDVVGKGDGIIDGGGCKCSVTASTIWLTRLA